MALKTDYKNDIFDGSRKYMMTENTDGSVSFEDVTEYTQQGDNFGASDINTTNQAVNALENDLNEETEGTGWLDCTFMNGASGTLKAKKVGEKLILKGSITNMTSAAATPASLAGKIFAKLPSEIDVSAYASIPPVNTTPQNNATMITRFDLNSGDPGIKFVSSTRSTFYNSTTCTFNVAVYV